MKDGVVKVMIGVVVGMIILVLAIARFISSDDDEAERFRREQLWIENARDEGRKEGLAKSDSLLGLVIAAREPKVVIIERKLDEPFKPTPPKYTIAESDSAYNDFIKFATENK